jgi:signal transduction histidine kinase/ligand-binding sensor domain-containing protein
LTIARSISSCLLLLISFATSAWAVDPNKHISQYAHAVWRIQDGFFNGAPNAITQTTDGYIWIGTPAGLIRFDGVRFVPWTPPPGKSFSSSNEVFSLLGGKDGSLWIGTGSNLARLKGNDLINYSGAPGRVNSIIEDRNGTIWFTRTRVPDANGPLCQVIDTNLRCYGKADGITPLFAQPVVEDLQGNFWIGSTNDLTRWSKTSSSTYVLPGLAAAKGLSGVYALAAASDGSLWIGINRTGPDLGLQRMDQGVLKPFIVPGLDGRTLEVNNLYLDRKNALWVGTLGHGIYRIYSGRVDKFSGANGLSSDAITGFYEDREGNMWTATSEGVDCFRDTRLISFSTREGLSADSIGSVLATKDGTVWIGNHAALDSLHQGNISSIRAKDGLPGVRITSMLEDHAGRLWLGVDNTLYVYEKGRFQPINRRDGSSIGVILSMTEDHDNNIWALVIGKPKKIFRIQDSKIQEEFPAPQIPAAYSVVADPQSGIWLGLESGDLARYQNGKLEVFPFKFGQDPRVRLVIAMPDGAIFGRTSAGLIGWKSGKRQTLSVQNGLPCDSPYSMVSDAQGDLWLYMKCGLVRIPKTELQKWWENAKALVLTHLFDIFDGARPSSTTFEPKASRSPDGKLWFANDYVVQMIDPDNLAANGLPPPVHIEEVIADKKSYGAGQSIRLPSLTRDLEIDYTALSFVAPKKVRFRYKLEGHDADWQDAGTRRQAFYNDLKPKKYTFRVMACNNDGNWNEIGAALEFSIAPAWYQTYSFLIMSIAAGLFAVWGLYRLRVRQISRVMSARFDERLAERTRVARELHDTFLQTVQGSKMVADHALKDTTDRARMARAMEQLSTWLGQATEEGRAALNSLRASTKERNDLAEAFRRAIEEGRQDSPIEISFSVRGASREMHPVVRDEIYRIGYEAIRNACAHSGGERLEVSLEYAHDLTLRVSDNGSGIDSEILERGKDNHFGLRGMRERAERIGSKLTLVSSPGSGAAITLIVPGRIIFRSARPDWSERLKSLFSRN